MELTGFSVFLPCTKQNFVYKRRTFFKNHKKIKIHLFSFSNSIQRTKG